MTTKKQRNRNHDQQRHKSTWRWGHWLLSLPSILLLAPIVWTAQADSAMLPGSQIALRDIAELEKKVSGNLLNPTARDLIAVLRTQLDVLLALDDSVV